MRLVETSKNGDDPIKSSIQRALKKAELEKKEKREREELWQKIKPDANESKKWQKGLNEVGRFQFIEGIQDVCTYVIDTKRRYN